MAYSLPRIGRALAVGVLVLADTAVGSTGTAFAAVSAATAPSSRERSQELIIEGDEAYASGDMETAISKYRASYYSLEPKEQGSYLGSLPIRKATRAFDELTSDETSLDQRVALLRRQRVLIDEFLAAVDKREGAVEEVGEDVLQELREALVFIDSELDAYSTPKEEEDSSPPPEAVTTSPRITEPVTDPGPRPSDAESDAPPRPRDWLGLGLTIGGGTMLAAGLGVSAGFFTIRSGAVERVDSGGDAFAPGTQLREDYLEQEDARARTFLIVGASVAGAGLATAIGGIVRLVIHRRRTSSEVPIAFSPRLDPRGAGLGLSLRF